MAKTQAPTQPEIDVSEDEAELLGRAERGEIACPWCELPLRGEKVVIEGLYEGVLLSCRCGFKEY